MRTFLRETYCPVCLWTKSALDEAGRPGGKPLPAEPAGVYVELEPCPENADMLGMRCPACKNLALKLGPPEEESHG